MTDSDFPIQPDRNYRRCSDGRVFTGQQVLNILNVANPFLGKMLLDDIEETDEPATNPNSRYGISS